MPRRHLALFSVIALLAYGTFFGAWFTSAPGGADSSGYLNSARLLARGDLTTTMKLVPELGAGTARYCFPLGFFPIRDAAVMAPTYPVGLPLLLAPASLALGWHAGPLVVVVGGTLLTLLLTFLIERELGASRTFAAVATAALGASPLLQFASVQVLSDGPSTAACVAAFYAALRGRRSDLWAAACGAVLALAVMIRPSTVVMLPALALVLWRWRPLAAAFLGGLPFASWFAWYNTHLWGKPWATGYGPILESFEWASVPPTLAFYAAWLPRLLPVAVFAVLGLVFTPWRALPSENSRARLALLLWIGTIAAFYAWYPVTRSVWWSLRFILPAFPAIAVLGALALRDLTPRLPRHGPLITAGLALALIATSATLGARDWRRLNVRLMKLQGDRYLELRDWIRANVPPGAIVSTLEASGTLVLDERPILRWDQVSPEDWTGIAAAVRASGRPLYVIAFDYNRDEALRERTPGPWEEVARFAISSIWRLQPAVDADATSSSKME